MKVKVWKFLALLFIVIFALPAGSLVHGTGVIGIIAVGPQPYGIAYDSGKGEIFVTNSRSESVSAISDSSNAVIATIAVREGDDPTTMPGPIAYDSVKGEIFIAKLSDPRIQVISDTNYTVVATINPNDSSAESIAYDSGKDEIFLVAGDKVFIISDNTNTVVGTIPVGGYPLTAAYDSGKGEMFVTNADQTVSVISDISDAVIARISVGEYPNSVAYDSGKGEIFVTSQNEISVISDKTNTVVAKITVEGNPGGITYDSKKAEIFVSNGGNTSVISDSNNTVVGTVPVGGGAIAYDSGKGELFEIANGEIYVISDASTLPAFTAPSVSALPSSILQNQTVTLTSTAVTGGVFPYTYQWFMKAPSTLSYSSLVNATLPSYNFTTSNSTAVGTWSFKLQVTDATGAAVNSTATKVTVNALGASSSQIAFSTPLIAAFLVVAVFAIVALLQLYRRHRKNSYLLSKPSETMHTVQISKI